MAKTWKCECEAAQCTGHKPGRCPGTGANVVYPFGIRQALCDECLDMAKKKYGDDLEGAQ